MTAATDWPKGGVARYLTVAGAYVELTHGNRTYPTPDGIGENRNHTTATCTGCPATEEFSHWRVVKRMTFDDKVRDPEAADRDARGWAQAHAEKCRAVPAQPRIVAYRAPGTRTLYCVACARQETGWQPLTEARDDAVCDFCGGRCLDIASRTLGAVIARHATDHASDQ